MGFAEGIIQIYIQFLVHMHKSNLLINWTFFGDLFWGHSPEQVPPQIRGHRRRCTNRKSKNDHIFYTFERDALPAAEEDLAGRSRDIQMLGNKFVFK